MSGKYSIPTVSIQKDELEFIYHHLLKSWLSIAKRIIQTLKTKRVCIAYRGTLELVPENKEGYRYEKCIHQGQEIVYVKSLVFEDFKLKYGFNRLKSILFEYDSGRHELTLEGKLIMFDPINLQSSGTLTADDVINPAPQTIPTVPQIVSDMNRPATAISTQRGGVPSLFGHMAGAWQNLATAVYEREYQVGANISINPDNVAGAIIFSKNYSDVWNNWMIRWGKQHQIYGGSIDVRVCIIGAATYVGSIFIGFYYGNKPDSELTLDDLLQYDPKKLGVSSFQEVSYTFNPISQTKYYFNSDEQPEKHVRLIAMLNTPLRNTYPTDGIEIVVQLFSKPRDWYCIEPIAEASPKLTMDNLTLNSLNNKTMSEIFSKFISPKYVNNIRLVINSPSLYDTTCNVQLDGINYNIDAFNIFSPVALNQRFEFIPALFKENAAMTNGGLFCSYYNGLTNNKVYNIRGCKVFGQAPQQFDEIYTEFIDETAKLTRANLVPEQETGDAVNAQKAWQNLVRYLQANCSYNYKNLDWLNWDVKGYQYPEQVNPVPGPIVVSLQKYFKPVERYNEISCYIFEKDSNQFAVLMYYLGFEVDLGDSEGNKLLYNTVCAPATLNKPGGYCIPNGNWIRTDENLLVSPLVQQTKQLLFNYGEIGVQTSKLLNQVTYPQNNYMTNKFSSLLSMIGDSPFVDITLYDDIQGMEVVFIRYVRSENRFIVATSLNYGISQDISKFVVKNASLTYAASNLRQSKLSFKDLQQFDPVKLQGAGWAMLGGGALSGIGNGLATMAQMNQQKDMFYDQLNQNANLWTQGQENWMQQKGLDREQARAMLEKQQGFEKEMSNQKFAQNMALFGAETSASTGGIPFHYGGMNGNTTPAVPTSSSRASTTSGTTFDSFDSGTEIIENGPALGEEEELQTPVFTQPKEIKTAELKTNPALTKGVDSTKLDHAVNTSSKIHKFENIGNYSSEVSGSRKIANI